MDVHLVTVVLVEVLICQNILVLNESYPYMPFIKTVLSQKDLPKLSFSVILNRSPKTAENDRFYFTHYILGLNIFRKIFLASQYLKLNKGVTFLVSWKALSANFPDPTCYSFFNTCVAQTLPLQEKLL